jgi:NDP-sugar pyrophosphorylase family protein
LWLLSVLFDPLPGPDVSIGEGCVIGNGVRLSSCVVMKGVKVKDHSKVRLHVTHQLSQLAGQLLAVAACSGRKSLWSTCGIWASVVREVCAVTACTRLYAAVELLISLGWRKYPTTAPVQEV